MRRNEVEVGRIYTSLATGMVVLATYIYVPWQWTLIWGRGRWKKMCTNSHKKLAVGANFFSTPLYRVRSNLNFETGQNEIFQSVPVLSDTYRSCFVVKSICSMTRRFFRGLLIQWSASAVCHSLSDIRSTSCAKNHAKAVLCSDISIVSCWTTLWDVAT